MATAVDVGTGSTLTFGTSAFEADILLEDFDFSGFDRPVIDITHMGSTGSREYMLGDLYDTPTLNATVQWNPDEEAPSTAAAETITATFPIPAGKASGATMAGSGAVVSWGATIPVEDKMTASLTIRYLNDITWADSAT